MGDFTIDDEFKSFNTSKYIRITQELEAIEQAANANVARCIAMIDNIALGNCEKSQTTLPANSNYQHIQQHYNDLVESLMVINHNTSNLKQDINNGNLDAKIKSDNLQGIWLENTNNINDIIQYFLENKDEFVRVLKKVADGDLTQQVEVDAKGEMLELKNVINQLVNQLEQFTLEVTRVAKEVGEEGLLGGRARVDNVSGMWLELTSTVNEIVNTLTYQVRDISEVTTAIAEGDLSKKITVDAKGEMLELKNTINTTVGRLSQFASEVTRVAKEVGTDGLLGGQAQVQNASGTWLELTNNVNDMANSITYQVRNISEVTTAIAEGNLTQKITVQAAGEVQELKNTINTMIDQLSQFTAEVTKVTKEVGSDGKFGVQAEVEDVSGVWLDLTNNVNVMSKSLAEADEKNRNQSWIKDGISILSKQILHKDWISEQFQTAIIQICRYIQAGTGAIYIYDSAKNRLELESSFAYQKEDAKKVFCLGEGVIGQVAYDRKPILMEVSQTGKVIQTGITDYPIVATYVSPLIFKGNLVGVMEVAKYSSFTTLELEYLESALSVLAGSFYAAILQSKDHKALELLSNTDALTGLYNRGYFDKLLPKFLRLTQRNDGIISFAMADIDYFKNFNDQYGHQMGDEVLKQVANVLKANLKREDDYCFRIGGEEFGIIFTSESKKSAYRFMDNIRRQIAELQLKNEKYDDIKKITISMGVTCQRALEIKDAEALYQATDELLYKAKKSGRNRVELNN